MRRRKKRQRLIKHMEKGSFTVEASVIVPMIVVITAALCVLTCFTHNCNYYLCAALETALAGNSRYITAGKEDIDTALTAAVHRAEERIADQPFPGRRPDKTVEHTEQGTKVSFSGQRFSLFSRDLFDWSVETEVKRVRPVRVVRLAREGRKLIEKAKESE